MITFKKQPGREDELKNILHPVVKEWFFKKFTSFSLPQLYSVAEIHSRRNILVSAPTGATKTLTGFLSILNELVDSSKKGILEDRIYCVYISPLKALNNDIEKNLKEPLKEMEEINKSPLGIRVAVRTGDTTSSEKSAMLKKPPHILITTPESLAIVLSSIKFKEHLRNVEWCIVDEIHALAENKRGVHLSLSIERLEKYTSYMTRIGLSATISPLEEVAKFLVGYNNGKERDCIIVDVQFIKELDLKVISPVPDLIIVSAEERHKKMYEVIDALIQQHTSTLIFTNTRSATERVVDHLKNTFPKKYTENAEKSEISGTASQAHGIGAHHGSLSKEHRFDIEKRLREGKLKVVVSSTSLELGIDIGYIDLVILLGSPKSVARCLQRIGRSGHKLHEKAKGRIIVMDRDDLVECSVLLKASLEKKIDKIHIPKNCLDVLSQQIIGIVVEQKTTIEDIFALVKSSYCYHDLSKKDFTNVLEYLSGKYVDLEDRHIYAKLWIDEDTKEIGRRGKLARVLYMTNIGTIPDETYITVKIGEQTIGKLDEGFLEKLKRGDVFVLGGNMYEFLFSRGMVAQVKTSVNRPPTVPSWVSEMLPLSFDLANEIGKFRRYMDDLLTKKRSKEDIIKFINDYLYVDEFAANAIYEYFREQFKYAEIPSDKKILIEAYGSQKSTVYIFHTLFGRRVNDVLSRCIAFAISRTEHRDVEIGINDNGFYITAASRINPLRAFKLLKSKDIRKIAEKAIEHSEVMKRRFRHCATRALMILRQYKGRKKGVGRQQVSSMILMNALKRISDDFCILKEARREVLEDLMDIDTAAKIMEDIEEKRINLKELTTQSPSPFSFNLVAQGYLDILKMEDKIEFLKRMHEIVMAKINK